MKPFAKWWRSNWVITLLGLGALIIPNCAFAQETIMLGVDSTGNVRRVQVGTTGQISIQPSYCGTPQETKITLGTTATSVPANQTSGRTSVMICNSLRNTNSAKVTCRIDGSNPTATSDSPGLVLDVGDCATYAVPASITPKCISDTATTAVTTLECT